MSERKMKMSDIIISDGFANSTPSERKVNECRSYWNKYHNQDRYLVVSKSNKLIDGYIQYLVLKENNIENAEVKISNKCKKYWKRKKMKDHNNIQSYRNEETTYVYGKHLNSNCDKTFVWRVPKNWTWFKDNIQIGDSVLCETRLGVAPVIVTKVEIFVSCPVDFPVKKIAKKEIRRNGYVLE